MKKLTGGQVNMCEQQPERERLCAPVVHTHLLIASAVLVLTGGVVLWLCRSNAAFADWYVAGPFQFFPNVIGRLTGLVPFSVYELAIYVLIGSALWVLSRGVAAAVMKVARRSESGAARWKTRFCGLIFFGSLLFCMACFTILGNYGRSPLAGFLDLQTGPASVEELQALCEGLAADAEAVLDQVERDSEGRFQIDEAEVQKSARAAMYNLGEMYDVFKGYYPQPKPVLWSEGMSWINITGMYSPFTIEANYNAAVTDYVVPYTICHELAHLRGIIREDEAGFAAWLACYHSDDPALQYSGAVSALRYGINALYRELPYEDYAAFYNALPIEIRWDLYQNSLYWQRHTSVTATVGSKVNDVYLKVNAQEGGTKSYGRMIDLLMAYRRADADLV